ncbi:uncharacterized protein LOC130772545 isoform X6 [Actinidia eriantha]|uniref:uncharacterized protein LOC130772545 isoform X6 n=1 Tax=Actinidia eriantha TaxID=165200 RepID=UPI002585B887|nr:uncharacterized protein LOC130772545 isoform X6 [Actinidia eriantha]
MADEGKYSCETREKTLEWIHAIIVFLKPYRFFLDAHVVNFFKDRLWEAVDKEWIDCLRNESVENVLRIPSGVVQDNWPASLKKFVLTSRSLAIPRERADLQKILPDLHLSSLNNVLSQGMNQKKKHEIETLAGIVSSIARSVGASTVVDVGAGQGAVENTHGPFEIEVPSLSPPPPGSKYQLLLAGLHACGDLSVTMLRTFLECDEVKAVVSIGCCYNLLSEERPEIVDPQCGFPMSKGVKHAGLLLGRSSCDLACQSAERWSVMGRDAGLHNFELHAFRAAFQMVLFRYYPEIMITSPTIGRRGKALRRQQNRRILESPLQHQTTECANSLPWENCKKKEICITMKSAEEESYKNKGTYEIDTCNSTLKSCGIADSVDSAWGNDGFSSNQCAKCDEAKPVDKYLLFERFSHSGLHRLGLHSSNEIDFAGLWKETEPFTVGGAYGLIGPYWSLRAALGPVLETMILLDRLLFLQEQDNPLEAVILPIFDPILSPRNLALIAKKI